MKVLTTIDLLALPSLETPPTGHVGFGAKADGLYQKIGTVETKLSVEGHTHTKSQITDFPTSMPASDVYAWAKAATKPAYTYTEVGAAAASHTHSYLPLAGGTLTGAVTGTTMSLTGIDLLVAGTRCISYYGPAANGYLTQMQTTATAGYGTHGSVTGDWALYNKFSGTTNRGWIWQLASANVASISGTGAATFNGSVTAPSFIGALTGNASTATTLATARTIAISGGATGTATSFNGSADITIPVTSLDASKLTSGTVPNSVLSGTYDGISLRLINGNTVSMMGTITRSGIMLASRGFWGAVTGAIVFIAPYSLGSQMNQFEISGFNYSPRKAYKYILSNYNYTAAIPGHLLHKVSLGSNDDISVRVGRTSSGNWCIILGDESTTWQYPQFELTKVMGGNVAESNVTGWTTDIAADLSTYTDIMIPTYNAGIATDIYGNAETATMATNLSRSVLAGNGLTGGGALSADVTLTMGTPSTLTAASTNAVTATSHTHAITTTAVGAASTIVQTDANGAIGTSRFGTYGVYSAAQTQGVWGMGSAYMVNATTTGLGTLYGLGYSYISVGGSSFANEHQIHFVAAGTATASISLSTGKVKANTFIGALTGNADTATSLSSVRTFAATGDATGSVSSNLSAGFSMALTLANSGVTAGTYRSVTVDAKGRVTAGTNPTTVAGYGLTDVVTTSTAQTITGAKTFGAALTASVSVTTPKVIFAAAGWSVEQSGTEVQFKYNGVIKQRLLSDGSIVGIGEITAFGSTV